MSFENRIDLLRKILKIASINAKESQVADVIQQTLAPFADQLQCTRIQYAPGRENLVVDFNVSDDTPKILGFNGHLDVVDPGDTDLWHYPPFAATIANDRLYGRGASDMKAGVAAMVSALTELLVEKVPLAGGVRLLFTVGEEIDNFGARQLGALGYAKPLTALIVGEPTDHHLWYAHKGIIDFTAQAIGKSAHGAMPQLGINAIDHLFDFYSLAKKEMAPILAVSDPNLGHTTFNVTLLSGGNQINSIPQFAKLRGNIRTVSAVPNATIITALKQAETAANALAKHHLELTIDSSINAISSTQNSEIMQIAQEAVQTSDWPAEICTGAPTTDASLLEDLDAPFPFVVLGPGNNSAHQVDEYVEISDYMKMTDIYKNIMVSYLKA